MNTNTIIDRPLMSVHLAWDCADADAEGHSRVILIGLHSDDEIAAMDAATIESIFDTDDEMDVSLQAFRPVEPKPVDDLVEVMREVYQPDDINFYSDIVEFVATEMPCACGNCGGVEMPERDAAIAAL